MIICLLIPLGAVSASDINNTADDQVLSATPNTDTLSAGVNNGENNDTLSVNDENVLSAGPGSGSDDVLGTDNSKGSYSDLNTLIKFSTDKVELLQDYEYKGSSDDDGITISKSINIYGNGFTIDGKSTARGFTVTSSNVTIKGINIVNCKANSYGASVYWTGDYGKLLNVTISNGYVSSQGFAYAGGISWWGKNGTIADMDMSKVNWVGSSQYRTGVALACAGDSLKVYNSTFHDIKVTDSLPGGLISFLGASTNTYMYGCNFTECYTTNFYNGVLFCEGSYATIEKCNFKNTVNQGYGFLYATDPVSFKECTFDAANNHYIFNTIVNCEFEDCNFTNFVKLTNGNRGNSENNKFTGCEFINGSTVFDSASAQGSGLDIISYCNFTHCKNVFASNYGPLGYSIIDHCIFKDVTSNYVSGSIISIGGKGVRNTVTNCTFNNCISTYDVYAASSTMSLIKDNYKINGSAASVNNTGGSYVKKMEFTVEEGATGDGSDGNSVNISYALNNIAHDGIVYIKSGTYNLNNTRYTVDYTIKPEKNVIIANGTFSLVKGYNLENITFVNLSDRIVLGFSSIIYNCTIKDVNRSSYLIYMNTHTSCINCSILDCNIRYIFARFGHGANGITIKDLNVSNVDMNYFINDGLGFVYNTFENINFTKCNITKFFNNAQSDNFYSIVGNRFLNFIFRDCNITGNLFYKTISYNTYYNDMTFDMITIVNCNLTGDYIFYLIMNCELNNINISNCVNVNNTKVFTFTGTDNKIFKSVVDSIDPVNSLITSSCSYTLDDFTVSNVNVSNAISVYSGMTINSLNFTDVNFTGGVIANLVNNVVLKNSNFTNYKGHFNVTGDNVNVLKCNFIGGNNSDLNGSSLILDNANFFVIKDSIFTSNLASNGTVYISDDSTRPVFTHCTFSDNIASYYGGALYIESTPESKATVGIDDSTNQTISTGDSPYYRYNGLYGFLEETYSVLFMINDTTGWHTEIEDNPYDGRDFKTPTSVFAKFYNLMPGGTVYFVRTGDIFDYSSVQIQASSSCNNISFYGNDTIFKGISFVALEAANDMHIYNITFSMCENDGAVIINASNCIFDNCSFINNNPSDSVYGAALTINGENLTVTNSKFINNTLKYEDPNTGLIDTYGGAIYINASNIWIENCNFSANGAGNDGSHIYITENQNNITLFNNSFDDSVRIGGGDSSGVVLQGTNIVCVNNTFFNNTGKYGSAISLIGNLGYLKFTGNNITNSSSEKGALYLDFVNNYKFTNVITDNYFNNNSAIYGGALFISDIDNIGLSFNNNNYTVNYATYGGAIYVDDIDVIISDSKFVGNNATFGGAVYVNADDVTIRSVDFIGNNATFGGALYVNALNTNVIYSKFFNNTANESTSMGSAVYVSKNGGATLTNVELNDNYVYDEVRSQRGDIFVDGGKFADKGITYGTSPYQQYLSFETIVLTVVYVSQNGGGKGVTPNDSTTLDDALSVIDKSNSIIYLVGDDITVTDNALKNLENVTIVNYNDGKNRKITGNNKYLFNHPKKIKKLSLNNYLSTKNSKK